ncbi:MULTISPECIES: class I SAM-dependent methyltransferase [Sphingopyxis]|nr:MULTISPECIES: class I SAM-dependent methyltransferase [Sphingopyxis]
MNPEHHLGPDDPCGCGNGRRYRDCHQRIVDAPEGEMLAIARTVYAEEWAGNASAYQEQGLYGMLAEHLAQAGDVRALLDVGCGRGHGLAALRSAFPAAAHLIGVDENPECLEAAASLLAIKAPRSNIRRGRDEIVTGGRYVSTYRGTVQIGSNGITLIQSDVVVQDPEVERVLDTLGPLDALTLWFSGVHKARSATEIVRHFKIKSDAEHRTLIENRALAIAGERLRPGGALHLVVRACAIDIDQVAHAMRLDYSDWLEDKPFRVESIGSIPYEEPADGIVVRSTDSGVSAMPNYAISILIRREG